MSANSGIAVSSELTTAFGSAVSQRNTRFILVSIVSESLTIGEIVPPSGTFSEDLSLLPDLLEDKIPSYILAKLDDGDDWLYISYVPEIASVRDKMLYASSRASLSKGLGDQRFKDFLFATTKADLTAESYAAHKRHTAAPKPLSAREAEIEEIRAAERISGTTYEGSSVRKNHLGGVAHGHGLRWTTEAEEAMKRLGEGYNLVVLSIDIPTEALVLTTSGTKTIDELPSSLPSQEPSFAFFAWDHDIDGSNKRDIISIYACPSTSTIKNRMIYSSGLQTMLYTIKSTFGIDVAKKLETSDPADLDIAYLKTSLGGVTPTAPLVATDGRQQPFAKPRGPARKR